MQVANNFLSFVLLSARNLTVMVLHMLIIYCKSWITGLSKKNKALTVTGRGGLWGDEMLRTPHCLHNRLTVNCEILATCSSTYSPVRTSQEAHSVSIK
jgi:hypothetical protein